MGACNRALQPEAAVLLLLCASACQFATALDTASAADSVTLSGGHELPNAAASHGGKVASIHLDTAASTSGKLSVRIAQSTEGDQAALRPLLNAQQGEPADTGETAEGGAGDEGVHRPSIRKLLHTSNPPSYVQGQTFHVTATGRTNGTSPSLYGLSLGNANAGSNWLAWMSRMGMNYGRLFVATNVDLRGTLGANFGKALDGTSVSSLGAYNTAVSQLRSSAGANLQHGWKVPLLYSYYSNMLGETIDGREYQGAVSTVISQLQGRGVTMLVVLSLTCKTTTKYQLMSLNSKSAAYWQERWELYKYVYQFGRYMAGKGVGNIEIYNEPNLDNRSGCLNNQYWLDNVRIRSEALRAAYADFGGKPLNLIGPPYSNPNYAGTFGQVAVQNNELMFPSNTRSSSHKNLDRYSYHVYGGIGYFYGVIYLSVKNQVHHDYPMPTDITEYGITTSSSVPGATGCIANQAPLMSRLSSTSAYLLGANVPRLNIFKASQTISGSGVSANGLHWADNQVAPYDYGDVTLMGEAAGLIMRKTAGGKTLYQVTTSYMRRAPTTAFAVADANSYYLYVVNDDTASKPLSVNVAAWHGVAAGATVIANQVSASAMTLVTGTPTLSKSHTFSFSQPAHSVIQFVVPKGKPVALTRAPTDDASVYAGTNQGANYGSSGSLNVALSSTASQSGTAAAFIKFAVSGVAVSNVQAATLSLTVRKTASATSTLLILGVGSSWSQGSITWNNAPSLKTLNTGQTVNRISRNYIDWLTGPQPVIVGHLVVPGGTANKRYTIDVSDYVKNVLNGRTDSKTRAAFAIVRLFRYNAAGGGTFGYPSDSLGSNQVIFVSKEGGASGSGPRLKIYHH